MSPRSWQTWTDYRADALGGGRYDLLAEEYAYPLTVFVGGEPQVVRNRAEAWAFFQSFHGMLRERGIVTISAHVVAEDLPRGGRMRLWCDWFGEGPGLPRYRFASTVCYSRLDGSEARIEMLEFTRLDLHGAVAA